MSFQEFHRFENMHRLCHYFSYMENMHIETYKYMLSMLVGNIESYLAGDTTKVQLAAVMKSLVLQKSLKVHT